MALTEYEPGTAFPGVIGRTTEESSPAWPRPLRAAAGAPNILWVVLDDTALAIPSRTASDAPAIRGRSRRETQNSGPALCP